MGDGGNVGSVVALQPHLRGELLGANDIEASGIDIWLSAQQIADLRLPGLPKNKRKVNELASRERWAFKVAADGSPLARTRKGQGGGIEYHADLFPPAARLFLAKGSSTGSAQGDEQPVDRHGSIWSWFEQQNDKARAEAKRRLGVLEAVGRAEATGLTRSASVAVSAAHYSVAPATIWNWLQLVSGVEASDWLPNLAPRRVGGGVERDVDHAIWTGLISDYLRPEKPTWESCYTRWKRVGDSQAITLPSSRTLFRKMEREVDPLIIVKRREGREAHARTMPPQIRTVANLHAMEIVNIDGHRWDVFVRWPDGKIARPLMVAIQDVMSRKILAWRLDESENAVTTRLAFLDLFRDYGIPKACLLDNGRAFASKWITGGAKTRFRFKIKPDDPTGLLPALGINPKWATPYHGQAKPIERAFRDLCDTVAKHPAFSGAYTGNNPQAKPENYGSKAVDLDKFVEIIRQEIHAHNARAGRRTEMANGRSFDDAFNESYAAAPIGKATSEQLRLAQLTADDKVRTHRQDGSVTIAGNKYWSEELSRYAGDPVVVRFDPDNLHSEIHVYTRDDKYIATAQIWSAAGFADMAAAGRLKKMRSDHRKATAKAEDALNLMSAAEVAAMQPSFEQSPTPDAGAIRPVRYRGRTAAALKPVSEASNAPSRVAAEPNKIAAIDRLAQAVERQLRIVE